MLGAALVLFVFLRPDPLLLARAQMITQSAYWGLRHDIGIDNIAWECDYPHTDTTWPTSPEHAWGELQEAGCSDEEVHKITWQNSCRFFGWDPFKHISRSEATVAS